MKNSLKEIVLDNLKTPRKIQGKIEKYFDIGYKKLDLLEKSLDKKDYLEFIKRCNEQIDYLIGLYKDMVGTNFPYKEYIIPYEKIYFLRESTDTEGIYTVFLKKIESEENKYLEHKTNKLNIRLIELKEKRKHIEKKY